MQLSYITCYNFYYLASILANTNSLLVSDLFHLASTLNNINNIIKIYLCYSASALTNTNNIPKIDLCYLAIALTNTNDKADNFIKEEVGCIQSIFYSSSLSDTQK